VIPICFVIGVALFGIFLFKDKLGRVKEDSKKHEMLVNFLANRHNNEFDEDRSHGLILDEQVLFNDLLVKTVYAVVAFGIYISFSFVFYIYYAGTDYGNYVLANLYRCHTTFPCSYSPCR